MAWERLCARITLPIVYLGGKDQLAVQGRGSEVKRGGRIRSPYSRRRGRRPRRTCCTASDLPGMPTDRPVAIERRYRSLRPILRPRPRHRSGARHRRRQRSHRTRNLPRNPFRRPPRSRSPPRSLRRRQNPTTSSFLLQRWRRSLRRMFGRTGLSAYTPMESTIFSTLATLEP